MSNINQKPEKLASALYLITGFFQDQEPLKWKLRALASDLVSLNLSLRSYMFKERESARLEIRGVAEEIKALLMVARNAGLVSEPNHNLLHEELSKYLEILGFPEGLKGENGQAILSRNFFAGEHKELKSRAENEPMELKDKNVEKDLSYFPAGASRELLDFPKGHKIAKEEKDRPLKEFGVVSVKKNSRQSVIIGLLKRKKEIMIKDVSPLISGCSEKTIQRELLAMVQAGILVKTGEKRWSRYSLARP